MFFTNILRRYQVVLVFLCLYKISAGPIETEISQAVMSSIQLFLFHQLTICLTAVLTLLDWTTCSVSPISALANVTGDAWDRFRKNKAVKTVVMK